MQASLVTQRWLMVLVITVATTQSYATNGCPAQFIKIKEQRSVPENITSNRTLTARSAIECILKLKVQSCTCWVVDVKSISTTKFRCRLFLRKYLHLTTKKATDESSAVYKPDNTHCEDINCESIADSNINNAGKVPATMAPSFTAALTTHRTTVPPPQFITTTAPPPQPRNCNKVYNLVSQQSGVYTIYRPGYTKNVYCDMEGAHGWTTIQKRVSGTETFDRDWADYEV